MIIGGVDNPFDLCFPLWSSRT